MTIFLVKCNKIVTAFSNLSVVGKIDNWLCVNTLLSFLEHNLSLQLNSLSKGNTKYIYTLDRIQRASDSCKKHHSTCKRPNKLLNETISPPLFL